VLIDTNVWSELTRPRGEPRVIHWLRDHRDRVVLSTLVEAEMWYGVANAADVVQARRLRDAVEKVRASVGTRLLPFDSRAAEAWGVLTGRLRREGRIIGDLDTLIAAQGLAHRMPVVTRNVKDFAATGVELIDPWAS
jgi:predicted nucleic acid-binding protein